MSWNKAVFSTMVQEVGYDEERQEMTVTFNSGAVYAYQGVPEELAVQLSNAPSVGQMLNSEIKASYPAKRVR